MSDAANSAVWNTKLPVANVQVTYPWATIWQSRGGHEEFHGETPGEEFSRWTHPWGTFDQTTNLGDHQRLSGNRHHQFTSNGHSHTTEGPHDHLGVGGRRDNLYGGHHRETGADTTHATGAGQNPKGRYILTAGAHFACTGGPQGFGYSGWHGVHNDSDDSHHYEYAAGDDIKFQGGNYYRQVDGESGWYLTQGNMDTRLDAGKYHVYSKDMNLQDSPTGHQHAVVQQGTGLARHGKLSSAPGTIVHVIQALANSGIFQAVNSNTHSFAMNLANGILHSVNNGQHSTAINPGSGITHSAFSGQQIVQLLQSAINITSSQTVGVNAPKTNIQSACTNISQLLNVGGQANFSSLISAAGGLLTGAFEVASDANGGLTQCTLGLAAFGNGTGGAAITAWAGADLGASIVSNTGQPLSVGNGASQFLGVYANGFVGIGTGAPVAVLDVVGNGHFSANLVVGGSVLANAAIFTTNAAANCLTVAANLTANCLSATTNLASNCLTVFANASVNCLSVAANLAANCLTVTGIASISGLTSSGNSSAANFSATGNVSSNCLSVAANLAANCLSVAANLAANCVSVSSNSLALGVFSIGVSGYSRLPNGLLLQWGTVTANSTACTVSFPVSFAATCYSVALTPQTVAGASACAAVTGTAPGTVTVQTANTTAAVFYYQALGI